ncbi:hypothetical protein ACXGQW_04655 [Wenyingzhuangia sp. IMCC45533]
MMKRIILYALLIVTFKLSSQNNVNRNGLQSTVINTLYASEKQAKRYEIASVLFNSHHWQNGSIIIVELFNVRYQSGYEKYIVELGYGQGTGSSTPKLTLVDAQGKSHNAKVSLGSPKNHTTNYGGYPNKTVSIYVDVRYYSEYTAKITHLRNKVATFTSHQQIIINENPTSVNISDFTAPVFSKATDSLWTQNSNGINYSRGNVGIGTTNPDGWKLAVNGRVRAKEIKVETDWSDFVFHDDYQLPTIQEVENHIKQEGHLKDIPSAKEVEENGVFLGEMNSKLLQKIEELTLYTIQQQKEIESLKEEKKQIRLLQENLIFMNKRLKKLEH